MEGLPTDTEFMRYLRQWLVSPSDESCPLGGKAPYSSALSLSDDGNAVELSHFRTYHTPLKKQSDFIEALAAAERIAADLSTRSVRRCLCARIEIQAKLLLHRQNRSRSVPLFNFLRIFRSVLTHCRHYTRSSHSRSDCNFPRHYAIPRIVENGYRSHSHRFNVAREYYGTDECLWHQSECDQFGQSRHLVWNQCRILCAYCKSIHGCQRRWSRVRAQEWSEGSR